MRYLALIIASLIWTNIIPQTAKAASLDDLYRDIIRSDNQGYLPLFVKNRQEPEIIQDAPLDKIKHPPVSEKQQSGKTINLTNDTQLKLAQEKARQEKWEKTIKAVQENNVSPLDLEELNTRAGNNDGKATEILAWMYTNGIGVSQDLPTAFILYRKAENLKVPQAKENAIKVYKAMSAEQRSMVKN